MTSKKLRLMIMAGAVVLLALVGIVGPASVGGRAAADGGTVDLAARMLQTSISGFPAL